MFFDYLPFFILKDNRFVIVTDDEAIEYFRTTFKDWLQ